MIAKWAFPRVALASIAVGFATLAALGWVWFLDRTRMYEAPRWDPDRFVQLGGDPVVGQSLHVVAVNPLCPHCLISLEREANRRKTEGAGHRLAALIVDSEQRPEPGSLPRRGEDEVWWDWAGVWRHRWGHRIYGEVLVFGPDGKHQKTVPPAYR